VTGPDDDAPLVGVRVLDCGRLLPSGLATARLRSLGADVIKVESPPDGDYLRGNDPRLGGVGDMDLELNRGKRSVAVDVRVEEGREVVLRLAAGCDVFVESSRPGTFPRLGLGYADVAAVNPAVVYCSISGFGQRGPYAGLGAHGLSADAAAGLLRPSEERPHLPDWYLSVGPRAAGLEAAVAILGALVGQRRKRRSRYLDVSQWAAALRWNFRDVALAANGADLAPGYSQLGPRFDLYRTADGRQVLLCAPEPAVFARFCAAADRPDLAKATGSEVTDYGDDPELRAELEALIATRTSSAWLDLAAAEGIPIAPVRRPGELVDDPHATFHAALREEVHPVAGKVRLGPLVRTFAGEVDQPSPALGAHTDEVLAEIGIDAAHRARLHEEGVVA
jgi:formyl-CoA transferase